MFDTTSGDGSGPYPFGLDPAWAGADNELLFVNSMKMKLSVLIGVCQMFLGVCLRFTNAVKFKSFTDFVCECIPMLIFLVCFFGYMDWMIIQKWVSVPTTNPSLINSMISMGLGQPDKDPLYDGQPEVQGKLMMLTALSVPWLLLPKPIILAIQNSGGKKVAAGDEEHGKSSGGGHGHGHGGEFDLAEVVIHQVIETIEFVLGTVSHTASYLRLWALSLAHQQLSLVFFQKSLNSALESGNPVLIYIGFACLMVITAGVLLGMDVLECFLHTLRLHWVEFQSKFFKADGYAFAPFSHEVNLAVE
jgi:V-type H+-transporting ATPase subunit a